MSGGWVRVGSSAMLAVADPERVRRLREQTGQWRGWFPRELANPLKDVDLEITPELVLDVISPSGEQEVEAEVAMTEPPADLALESSEHVVAWPALDEVRLTVETELWMLHPKEPFGYDHPNCREIIELCGSCWHFGLLHALADEPLTRDELIAESGAPEAEYDLVEGETIERLIDDLLAVGLLESGLDPDEEERGKVIVPTIWMAWAVCPLLLAARIESESKKGEGHGLQARDWQTLMLMAARVVPLIGRSGSGAVRLVCELGEEQDPDRAVVTVEVEDGAIVDAVLGDTHDSPPAAEIVGTEDRWYRALIDFHPIGLTYGGDPLIGHRLIEMFAATLFGHVIDNAWSASRQ